LNPECGLIEGNSNTEFILTYSPLTFANANAEL